MTAQANAAVRPLQGLNSRLPTEAEAKNASDAADAIADALALDDGLVVARPDGGSVKIAPALGALIIELLEYVGTRKMVTLVPFGAKLTTQQAADMLNVSRPYLVQLLECGEIKYEEFGRHRLVELSELMKYRDERDKLQEEALEELARLGQEFDLA